MSNSGTLTSRRSEGSIWSSQSFVASVIYHEIISALKSSCLFSSHYSQIDLRDVYKVTGVATQGGDGLSEWVTSYKLQYTMDDSTWQYYSQVNDSSSQRLSGDYQNFIVVFLHDVVM